MVSSEDYIKHLVKTAMKLEKRMERGEYVLVERFLRAIVAMDVHAFKNIERETRSRELMEQALKIREEAKQALRDYELGDYQGLKKVIQMIINSGEMLLESEEHFVGYTIHEYMRSSIASQAHFLSELIEGITVGQAMQMLSISYQNGLDVVIGGSSLTNNKIGGDLDVGFKIDPTYAWRIPEHNLRDVVRKVVNKINKKCFRGYQAELGHAIMPHKWLHDKSALEGVPDIGLVEQFFMRRGFRDEPKEVLKDGKPYGPSGYAIFYPTGGIILVTPKIRKGGVVGLRKYW